MKTEAQFKRDTQRNTQIHDQARVRPTTGVVTGGINPQTERVLFRYYGGDRTVKILHPYLGMTSWIRVAPEDGTMGLIQFRSDTDDPEFVTYYNNQPETRIKSYSDGISTYRVLQQGEIDIQGTGLSGTFFGRRSDKDDRAGLIRTWISQDKLESGAKAPIHRRVLHQNSSDDIGDEERFGVVKRPKSFSKDNYIKVNGKYAKEYLRVMYSNAQANPSVLVDIREGNVINDTGGVSKMFETNNPLRMQRLYQTTSDQTHAMLLDDHGNFVWSFPQDAKEGLRVSIPGGGYSLEVGKDASVSILGTLLGNIHNNLSIKVTADTVVILDKAKNGIGMDKNGLFFQDSFGNIITLANLVWHTHTGNVGAPTSPMAVSVVLAGPGAGAKPNSSAPPPIPVAPTPFIPG